MRLTLRTLLAYLDNTLDPQDAELLKNKLSESGFATQLVQRIRSVLVNAHLSAPAPDAVGPVEEANAIGEYLDSTLPVEQVAEIERACLESDGHLAEAAACHQVLTIVLKKPAEIPQELRRRIYELPDRQLEDIAAGGSFSGVSIPPDTPTLQPLHVELPTSDATQVPQAKPIRPVGPDDSGVSDAPTRLREAEAGLSAEQNRAAIAGSRSRSVDKDTRIYGGSIRPSRIAPWLVSLGLAAVLLFVLAQLFQPLFDRKSDEVADASGAAVEASSDGASSAVDSTAKDDSKLEAIPGQPTTDKAKAAAKTEAVQRNQAASNPTPQNAVDSAAEVSNAEVSNAEVSDADSLDTTDMPADGDRLAAGGSETASVAAPETADSVNADPSGGAKLGAEDVATTGDGSEVPSTSVPPPPPPKPPMVGDVKEGADEPETPPVPERDRVEVAKVSGTDALITALVGNQWIRLKQEASIVDGVKVFGAPTFRSALSVAGGEISLVGPSQVEWNVEDDSRVMLSLDFGRMLITATQSDFIIPIRIGDEMIELRFSEPESVAAVDVSYFRAPGFDPLLPENRIPLSRVGLVKGTLSIESGGQFQEMQAGQVRTRRGVGEPELVTPDTMPTWIEPTEAPLEASARAGLLELLDGSHSLELQLREATKFRRSEVAALAGRALVAMGQADVYFGGDGIFSDPKQRTYWPDHFAAVLAMVDRNADSAAQVHDSIVRMDSANANPLLRLLTGFSQKQLAEGADAELVQMLDSPSTAVRVLALENLHKITGTTLYFRPDQENAVRRAPIIKKWEARLRKGDIRWQK